MSAAVLAFPGKPKRKRHDTGIVPFDAKNGLFHAPSGRLLAVQGPAAVFSLLRDALAIIEERALREGGMPPWALFQLREFAGRTVYTLAHDHNLPDLD